MKAFENRREKTRNYNIAEDRFSGAVCKLFHSLPRSVLGQEGEHGFEEVQCIPHARPVVNFWVELSAYIERTSRAICMSFCSLAVRKVIPILYSGIFPFCG